MTDLTLDYEYPGVMARASSNLGQLAALFNGNLEHGRSMKVIVEAALREFGEELAKMCEERGEICKQIAAGGTTHSYCLIFLGRAEECQERARAIRESL